MTSHNNKISDPIERRAVNSSGRLGSLYDACRDQVIDRATKSFPEQHSDTSEPIHCEIIKGNIGKYEDLLRHIGVEDELILSLLLKSTNRQGIGLVLNCPYPIDEYTRFFYYRQKIRIHTLKLLPNIIELTRTGSLNAGLTHVITSIVMGIDVIVVLQLPSDARLIKQIDDLLAVYRSQLLKTEVKDFKMSPEQKKVFADILRAKVCSHIPNLNQCVTFCHIIEQMFVNKKHGIGKNHPLSYILQSIKSLYPTPRLRSMTYISLSEDLREDLEEYVSQLRTVVMFIESHQMKKPSKFDKPVVQNKLNDIYNQCAHFVSRCVEEARRLMKLMIDIRSGRTIISSFSELFLEDRQLLLKDIICDLYKTITQDPVESCPIDNVREKINAYCQGEGFGTDRLDNSFKAFNENNQRRTTHSSSSSANKYRGKPTAVSPTNVGFRESTTQNKKSATSVSNVSRPTVPASKQKLHSSADHTTPFASLPSTPSATHTTSKNKPLRTETRFNESNQYSQHKELKNSDQEHHQQTNVLLGNTDCQDSLSTHSTMTSECHQSEQNEQSLDNTMYSPESYASVDDTINVLLVGETGVGKSTFINAFVNYLAFTSFDDAESSEPVVLIPVSFIITVGDNFEERQIKFGEVENPDNENFNDSGQSVTQHCKSYVFDLKRYGKKLRIIDTPGFGDTRGLEQDDYNMEHILQFINNLTHLNAICFLLKPNSSRLNMLFRMCLTELFSFLSPAARGNVMFCFTNGRSTFYTPGDTAPLLKKMLASASIKDIPFRKENTFCFDSESFRYLVALRNDIKFTGIDREEYEKSWSISVKESNRFISYINDNVSVYRMNNGWQSTRHAHFQVIYMIRPILEAMRNIVRNMILYKNNLAKEFIQLHASSVYHTDTYCLSCKGDMELVGSFWILCTTPHDLQDGTCSCSCPAEQHVPLNYMLDYECVRITSDAKKNSSDEILGILCDVCVKFARFLTQTHHGRKDDPFLVGLERMIEEETHICKNERKADLNRQLLEALTKIKDHHEQRMNKKEEEQKCLELSEVYDLIEKINKHPLVQEQMVAVRETQRTMMEQYEYEPQKI